MKCALCVTYILHYIPDFIQKSSNHQAICCLSFYVPCTSSRDRETYLGVEFYLFVSHGCMNDRESTCKFRNARSAFRNLHVDPLSFIPP